MNSEYELYIGCCNRDEKFQKELFYTYMSTMHAICIRYSSSSEDADDMLQEGFIKVFSKIDSFKWKGEGSFVAWIKTIFINNLLNNYKKNKKNQTDSIEDIPEYQIEDIEQDEYADTIIQLALDTISQTDILNAISQLPEQFRIVFNLFAIEGIKHKDIAEMLNIPIKTSTTRYLRAKEKLKKILSKQLDNKLQLQE